MAVESDGKRQGEELPPFGGSEDRVEEKIDRDLRDSFPASDPPGWVLGVQRRDADEGGDDARPPPTGEARNESLLPKRQSSAHDRTSAK